MAAGGGGMALGAAVLGGATLGVGLLVGGVIFNATGSKLSEQADEAWNQMLENEKEINKINSYLGNLRSTANSYYDSLSKVQRVYQKYLEMLESVLNRTTNWYYFTDAEQQNTETLVMLVGILYEMCKVKLVNQSSNKDGLNTVNTTDVNAAKKKANDFLNEMAA